MRITYNAKRDIVTTSFYITGATDISCATVDDSFNSVTTDLSGLLNGEYVNVTGFTESQNNGWHEVNGNSTAAKIISVLNLADEAAGDSITMQGYEHGYGGGYDLETDAQQAQPSVQSRRSDVESIGGQEHSLLHNQRRLWQVTTGIILKDDKKYWDEFFSSVRAKETFTFDPYGTVASRIRCCLPLW